MVAMAIRPPLYNINILVEKKEKPNEFKGKLSLC